MFYMFKIGHNSVNAVKIICCAYSDGAVDHKKVTRWFKKFHLGCKKLNNQARP